MDLSGFPTLLDQAFLEYRIRQTRQRLSVSLNSFASYMEFSPTIVNTWLNGKKQPSSGNLDRVIPKMVELLGPEVYDALGLARPDTDLQRLTELWSRIPTRYRHMLADQADKYAAEADAEQSEPAESTAEIDPSKPTMPNAEIIQVEPGAPGTRTGQVEPETPNSGIDQAEPETLTPKSTKPNPHQ